MLSEGSVAVATRRGRLQATAQGCCRTALEAEPGGPGRQRGGAWGGGGGIHRDATRHTHPPTKNHSPDDCNRVLKRSQKRPPV